MLKHCVYLHFEKSREKGLIIKECIVMRTHLFVVAITTLLKRQSALVLK